VTPLQIIAAIKDVLIVAAVIFVTWFVYHAGQNQVKVSDVKALSAQIEYNGKVQEGFHQEITDAFAKRDTQVGQLAASIGAQHTPILLCHSPGSNTVPGNPPGTSSVAPPSGAVDAGPGIDIRASINAFELKYESVLASCSALKASWPTVGDSHARR